MRVYWHGSLRLLVFCICKESMDKRRTIAVFDFDGTLTTKDTLLEFIKFACGRKKFLIGFLIHSPLLVLMRFGLYPNWRAKERVFSWFFKGMKYDEFVRLGDEFADEIKQFANLKTTDILRKHIQKGHDIYVITASIEEWVRPYCRPLKAKDVLGTKVEVVDGVLTGRFNSRNCYGKEKVNRLLNAEPNRLSYYLYAYGDSRGDKEIIDFADKGVYV